MNGVDWPQETFSPREHLLCVSVFWGRAGKHMRMNLQDSNDETQLLPLSSFSGSSGEHLRALPQTPGQEDGQHGTAGRGVGAAGADTGPGPASNRSQGRREVSQQSTQGFSVSVKTRTSLPGSPSTSGLEL